jgi:AraC-like DNA-binding protein
VIYRTCKPPPPLDGFIDNLWYWEGDAPAHTKDAIIAGTGVALLINLRQDALSSFTGDGYADKQRSRGIALCGTHATPFAILAHQPVMMGIQFKPGGIWPFLKPSANEVHDRHVALEDLWGRDAERLHERLIQAPTPDDKFEILLSAFMAHAPRALELHPAVACALARFQNGSRVTVAATAQRAEVSQKKLIRLFTEQVGMTPKLYLRIARFSHVIRDLHARSRIGWGDVVEQAGYYDQSHFIHDFRAFSGFAPTQWLKQRGPYMGHIPLVD